MTTILACAICAHQEEAASDEEAENTRKMWRHVQTAHAVFAGRILRAHKTVPEGLYAKLHVWEGLR